MDCEGFHLRNVRTPFSVGGVRFGGAAGAGDRLPWRGIEARAPLTDLAPRTREAVWAALPVRGQARHGIYSGSEVYLILPELMQLPPENATTRVVPGDVAFGWFAAGSFYGAREDYCEVCWFYDRDATPSTPEGPVPVSLFARLEQAEALFEVCNRMRLEGEGGRAPPLRMSASVRLPNRRTPARRRPRPGRCAARPTGRKNERRSKVLLLQDRSFPGPRQACRHGRGGLGSNRTK